MIEKRKEKRFKDKLVVICALPKQARLENISISDDISQAGIRLTAPENLSREEVLNLDINILYDAIPISLKGKVVWVKEEKRGGILKKEKKYTLGVKFIDADNVSRQRILDYVLRKSKFKQ